MSLFRQTADSLRATLAAMPMQSRVIALLLTIAIAVAMAFLVQGNGKQDVEYLFGGRTLGEKDLDDIELAFSRAGLNGWAREGRRLRIPATSRSEYYAALEDSASLPISLRSSVQHAINQSNPLESNEQRLSREMHAKEQDLGAKIASFPDIRWASVEYDRGERRGLSTPRPQSASVMVTPEGLEPLSRSRVQMIKELIRGSYAGMSSDDVVVIDANASSSLIDDEDNDPMLRKRREAEAMVEQKVRNLLVGFGPIRVAAYADIDPTLEVEKTVLKFDPERTTTNESSRKVEQQSNRPLPQGVPGVVPNAVGNRAASIDTEGETNRTKEEERESNGVVGQQYENSRIASLQVRRVRVSIGLPGSYYNQIWPDTYLRKNPDKTVADVPPMQPADRQELREKTETSIKLAVSPLLPDVAAGEDRFPLVEVFEYHDLPENLASSASPANFALTWIAESWQSMALVGLALIALLVARSAVRSSPSPPAEFAEGFGLELPAPPVVEENEKEGNDQMTITGVSLKDELTQLVSKNPEVAANVIRAWVGEAA